MKEIPSSFHQRAYDLARKILLNPDAQAKEQTLVSGSFVVLQLVGDKDAISLITPYQKSGDKVTSRLATNAVLALNK